ncbi:MAG: hypothetical protein LUE13_05020 [Akkermansiaceae bacterium]|nr:hypothetical protein [Akkermansiaceae bacterium]
MKIHLPCTLRRILLSLLLPVAGTSLSTGADLFQDREETLSFNNGQRRFTYNFTPTLPSEPTLLLSFRNNKTIEFLNNSINNDDGGAIRVDTTRYGSSTGQVEFLNNEGPITFIGNTSTNNGGAIAGGVLGLTFESNLGEIRFESNHAGSHGGAIDGRTGNEFMFKDNHNVIFLNNSTTNIDDSSHNYKTQGGAISTYGSAAFDGNNQVVFIGNSSQSAGAIYAKSLSIANTKEEVLFKDNKATGELWSPETAHGGALQIHYDNGFHFDLTNNTSVLFENNTATGSGGAIYLIGNGSTADNPVFQKNKQLAFIGNSSKNGNGGAIAKVENDGNTLIFQ